MKNKKRVYIIHPYTRGDQLANMSSVICCFNRMLSDGIVHPVCPLMGALGAHLLHPRTHGEWIAYDLDELHSCDAALIFDNTMPGFEEFAADSRGCTIEISECSEYGIPVFDDYEELIKWIRFRAPLEEVQ
jgi:hypothetical protein